MQTTPLITGSLTDEAQLTLSLNTKAPNTRSPHQGISQLSAEQRKQVSSGAPPPGRNGEIEVKD